MKPDIMAVAAVFMVAACTPEGTNQQVPANKTMPSTAGTQIPPDLTGWPIVNGDTKRVGTVATRRGKQGIQISIDVAGLPPGQHGVHIHENAKCEAPGFESAGGHWNWTNKQHGHDNPRGYHAGDLGNLSVGADGKAQTSFLVASKDWDPKAAGGLAVVIHAKADDEKSDPSGNSGARIACGVMYLRGD
jgi:Cu-Zn family superoxide dismutase